MKDIVAVKFRDTGKFYFFDPDEGSYKSGDRVIVDTSRGADIGTVVFGNKQQEESGISEPLKKVLRLATTDDEEKLIRNKQSEKESYFICKQIIAEHGLDMKLISCEYAFDDSKITFYFTADGRIDFRELVKDLAARFRHRIELRQIGARDETRMIGDIGCCGRELCCHSFLNEFIPVSIKMAKEQKISLNPQKISGVCGRLMCCLKYESDTYAELNKTMPKIGDYAIFSGREGQVIDIDILRQKAKVLIEENDDRTIEVIDVAGVHFIPKKVRREMTADEQASLMALMAEQEESVDAADEAELEKMEMLDEIEEAELPGIDDDVEDRPKNRDRKNTRFEGRDKKSDKKFDKKSDKKPDKKKSPKFHGEGEYDEYENQNFTSREKIAKKSDKKRFHRKNFRPQGKK
jgi:cell fate regulator YaaT (PSP1 superfamily)